MGKRKSKALTTISQKEMVALSEAYADCFSKDRNSKKWLEAFNENVSNIQKFNRELLKRA